MKIPLYDFLSFSQSNIDGPVIVSSVKSGEAGEAIHFVRNCQMFMPNTTIVLFDLGMSEYELQLVLQYCNSSIKSIFNKVLSKWQRWCNFHDFFQVTIKPLLINVLYKSLTIFNFTLHMCINNFTLTHTDPLWFKNH